MPAQTTAPSLTYQPLSTSAVTPTTAMQIADAYACVRALADAAASLPLIAYRRTADGRQRLDNATSALLSRPAEAVTQSGLIGQLVAHLQLHGNAYVGKFRGSDGQVDQLALLAPDLVTPRLVAGRPRYAVQGLRGETSDHGTDDLIHIRGLTTDGLLGLSPVRQCRIALGLSQSLTEHAAGFFENGARPGGILRLSQYDSASQLAELGAAWNQQHGGVKNAHRIAVVTGSVEFQPLTMPMDDVEFLAQRKLSAVEVARIFRVPPWVIGADSGESMTYSNTEQQSLQFVTYSLRPWLVAIEQALSADPDLFKPRQYCEFLLDALLRSDSKTRGEIYALALDPISGWMTRDEVRRRENLEPER